MDRISELLYKKIIDKIDTSELAELENWATTDARRRLMELSDDPEKLKEIWIKRGMVDWRRPLAYMNRQVAKINRSRKIRRIAVAALLLIGIVGLTLLFNRTVPNDEILNETTVSVVKLEDIKPGQVKATLTSSTGETVILASNEAGQSVDIAEQKLQFIDDIEELSLDVPRGGEYVIVLEDSTKVWLNSESQLHYPSTFAGDERRVRVSGEVYFNVKKDDKRPFYVETEGQVIRVYGTEFNVKAYEDEMMVYTTLESGSISLKRKVINDGDLRLAPGHQARLNLSDNKVDMMIVDTEAITGWRHGRFVFEEQRLEDIMRDLSRWYDFEYRFDHAELKDVVFKGSIPRYSDFKTALAIIETSGNIKFAIDEGTVVINKQK